MDVTLPAWVLAAAGGGPSSILALLWWRVRELERGQGALGDRLDAAVRELRAEIRNAKGGNRG